MRRLRLICCCVAMAMGQIPVLADEHPAPPATVGKPIADFQLTDYRGRDVSLADFKESRLVVVAFLGTDCPLAKLYGGRLQELSANYAPQGVTFLGINANRQDTLTQIAAYARRHGIEFPILKDGGNKVADLFQAQRTPEVFVLDPQRVVRYWGRIDDAFGIGYVNEAQATYFLRDALDELLAGKPVSRSVETSVGCLIGRVRDVNPNSPVTYSDQIARIFNAHCVGCHRAGEIGPFALTNYEEAVGWAEMIREVVNDKRMPPWHASPEHGKFRNDRSLSAEQIEQIDQWVRNGAPEGDRSKLPEPPTFLDGWQLPRSPDKVVAMRSRPFSVPATGEVRYQHFEVDPGFDEDVYISAAEIIPGNREVVHHVLVLVKPPGGSAFAGAGGGEFLVGYVPGSRVEPLPPGMAKMVPAGSKLIFQMHYTPNGTAQEDMTRVGFLFAKPEDVDHVVMTQNAVHRNLEIPPGADNYEASASSGASPIPIKLLALMPHMHLRGKSFRYEAVLPDKSREVLLDVPAYDFNWQTAYRLAEPLEFPAGTRLYCVAHYDNSERNPANPDPTVEVKWGDQTYEEMMIGYFDVAIPIDAFGDQTPRGLMRRKPGERVQENAAMALFRRLDANGDGVIELDELTDPRHRLLFPRIDADKDRKITPAELEAGLEALRSR